MRVEVIVAVAGLETGEIYEVDDPDWETCSMFDHLTLVGQNGTYLWNYFRIIKEAE